MLNIEEIQPGDIVKVYCNGQRRTELAIQEKELMYDLASICEVIEVIPPFNFIKVRDLIGGYMQFAWRIVELENLAGLDLCAFWFKKTENRIYFDGSFGKVKIGKVNIDAYWDGYRCFVDGGSATAEPIRYFHELQNICVKVNEEELLLSYQTREPQLYP